jgi:hypothetical protein
MSMSVPGIGVDGLSVAFNGVDENIGMVNVGDTEKSLRRCPSFSLVICTGWNRRGAGRL